MEERSDIRPQEERSILINFVLDKSGSMEIIREATVAGFNQFLRDQQEEGGSAAMTLTLFDTRFKTLVTALPVAEVRPLDRRSYIPGGNTALYDAIAHTLRLTDRYVEEHKPDQVLFVIMTDGQENASREFEPAARSCSSSSTGSSRPTTSSSTWAPTRIRTGWAPAWASPTAARSTTRPRRPPPRPPWSGCRATSRRTAAAARSRSSQRLLLSGARGPRPRLL